MPKIKADRIIPIVGGLLVAIAVSALLPVSAIGPDSSLYLGLADNIHQGRGFVDTIRNDNILPTIGHVLLLWIAQLLGLSAYLFTRICLGIGLSLIFLSLRLALSPLLAFISFFAAIGALFFKGNIIAGGVESSLILANGLFLLAIAAAIRGGGARRRLDFLYLGLALSFTILVRPILYPIALLGILFCLASAYWLHSRRYWRTACGALAVSLLVYACVYGVSQKEYGDSRLVTGTYSAIPLYSALNPYIDLNRTYGYDLLAGKAEAERELNGPPYSSWQERDKALKGYVIKFVLSQPIKATIGYMYRLARFTIATPNIIYDLLIVGFVLGVLINIVRLRDPVSAFFQALAIIQIAITALFVYAGARYLVGGIPFIVVADAFFLGAWMRAKGKGSGA